MQRLRYAAIVAALALDVAPVVAQDALEVISTDPPSPGTVVVGEELKVTIRYRLVSTEQAEIWCVAIVPERDSFNQGWSMPAYCRKGTGEVVLTFHFIAPAKVDKIRVTMCGPTESNIILRISHTVDMEWVDPNPKVKSNPDFEFVRAVNINRSFPQARKIYDELVKCGVKKFSWYSGEARACEIGIGRNVDIRAAQTTLRSCLNCTSNISHVTILTHVFERDSIYLGRRDIPDQKPLPVETLKIMTEPGLSISEFHNLAKGLDRKHGSELSANGPTAEQRAAARRRAAVDMARDESIWHVKRLPEDVASSKGIAAARPITTEESLKKGVMLDDIVRRHGPPDELRDNPDGGKSAIYFNAFQFVTDKTGVVAGAIVFTSEAGKVLKEATGKLTAADMIRDESIWDVKSVLEKIASSEDPGSFVVTDEDAVRKGVKLDDIVRRYGPPRATHQNHDGGTLALYFEAFQFMTDRAGTIGWVIIFTSHAKKALAEKMPEATR